MGCFLSQFVCEVVAWVLAVSLDPFDEKSCQESLGVGFDVFSVSVCVAHGAIFFGGGGWR